jgi:serine/threonine protein kinase
LSSRKAATQRIGALSSTRLGRPVDQARTEATRLGSYEIVRKLARGGMAELFLSRTVGPEGFEKLVVLKKILPSYAENPKFVRLFLDEAKLAATLDHPHIAHVYDMGKVDGHYFFTMEYVHGQDVRTTMRRTTRLDRKFPIDHAVQITRNVAAALHYAHERRRDDGTLLDIVHRDVSPSNVLVSYDGAVKLVDFGVAKATTSTVKTRTGTLKGKIAYMSPEQAKGAPVDRRSDIFSLGIMLWEMVTMQRLYKADNDLATIQMIINSKAQPPSHLRPDCTPELDRIITRALAINPDDRYQTAEQLQIDLDELVREQKLNQSTVSLRTHMHELFDDEIRAWSAAKASGQTLTEHMIEKATEMTTPVSESEIYAFEDFDDDEEELANQSESAAPTMTSPPPVQMRAQSETVVGRVSSRELPLPPAIDQGAMLQIARTTPASGVDVAVGQFPIAPREWRPTEAPTNINVDEDRRKRIIIGSSMAFGLIVFVIAIAARNPPPVVANTSAPEMPTGSRIEMKATPEQPPAEQAPVVEDPPVTELDEEIIAPAADEPAPKQKKRMPATKDAPKETSKETPKETPKQRPGDKPAVKAAPPVTRTPPATRTPPVTRTPPSPADESWKSSAIAPD